MKPTHYKRSSRLAACICLLLSFTLAVMVTASPFNIRDYGALGDGKHLDSPAINKAIEAAAVAGGGTVLVPAGTYLSGSIRLKSNIHLLIDAGATILGAPQEMNAYDEAEEFPGIAYQDGGHTYFRNSLIHGEGLENVSITGMGMINGGGMTADSRPLDDMCGYKDWATPGSRQHRPLRLGNKAIALKRCRFVVIRDLKFLRGGHFAILATGCDNVTIDNVTIDSQRDGINIDCCHNTIISNCRVNTAHDDAICIKSSAALGELRLTENLTITNCQVSGFKEGTLMDGTMVPGRGGCGRIKFGTEASGGFRNVTVSNCTFRSCRGLAVEQVDGGIMENLTFSNLSMVDVRHYAIYITTGKRNRSPLVTEPSRGRNILVSNVIADGVDKLNGIHISGLPERPLEGIRLQNIRLTSKGGGSAEDAMIKPRELGDGYPEPYKIGTLPAYGLFARHVRGLELADIHVDFIEDDKRHAAVFQNIDGLDIDHFKAEISEGVQPAVYAPDVKDISVRNSPTLGNR